MAPSFNAAASMLGLPAVNVAVLAVDGIPVGVQVADVPHADAQAAPYAAWIDARVRPISV